MRATLAVTELGVPCVRVFDSGGFRRYAIYPWRPGVRIVAHVLGPYDPPAGTAGPADVPDRLVLADGTRADGLGPVEEFGWLLDLAREAGLSI